VEPSDIELYARIHVNVVRGGKPVLCGLWVLAHHDDIRRMARVQNHGERLAR
jgi:hypothetical protein